MQRGSSLLAAVGVLLAYPAAAEITTDGSLGPVQDLDGPDYFVAPDLGLLDGNNLFHSFSRFDIGSGESAEFAGPPEVQRVISRVTGNHPSSVDGLIRNSISGADFYFINPAGIVFGGNAVLDVSGASYFSTADRILIGLDGVFDASSPQQSRLTADAPSAFGFVGDHPAAIDVGSLVTLGAGRSISLVGGDITIRHRADEPGIIAEAGRVNLVSVGSPGNVPLGFDAITDAALQEFDRLGRISLVRSDAGDSAPEDLLPTISTGSPLPPEPPAGTPPGDGGTPPPDIPAAGTIYIRGGQITLDSAHVSSTNRSGTDQQGAAIDLAAREQLRMRADQGPPALVEAVSEGGGDSGAIRLSAGQIDIRGSATATAQIISATHGGGNSAPIDIRSGTLTLADGAAIASNSFGSGDGGDIHIDSGMVLVQAGNSRAAITSSTFSEGRGGDIRITADSIILRENPELPHVPPEPGGYPEPPLTGLLSEATQTVTGNAGSGSITINTNKLEVHDGAVVSTAVLSGSGDAGDIDINAGSVLISGQNSTGFSSKISANTGPGANTLVLPSGRGGNITVNADELRLLDGGTISSVTAGLGDAGDIDLAAEYIALENVARIATRSQGPGQGGNLSIASGQLSLSGRSILTTEGEGTGNAGDMEITADSLLLKDSALLSSSRISDGGNISIQVGHLIDLQDSEISTAVGAGAGHGGNITADAEFIVLDHSRIIANAFGGNGGNIRISVGTLLQSPDSVINASSTLGIDGKIDLEIDNDFIDQSPASLPRDMGENQVASHCVRDTRSSATLSISVFELLPASPDSLQSITRLARYPGEGIDATRAAGAIQSAIDAGRISQARQLLQSLASSPDGGSPVVRRTRLTGLQGDIALRERRTGQALKLARQAYESARQAGGSALLAESGNHYGNVLYTLGDFAAALEVYDSAIEAAESGGQLEYIAPLFSNAARAAARQGSIAESMEFLRQAGKSLDRWDDQPATADLRIALASQAITLLEQPGTAGSQAGELARYQLEQAIRLETPAGASRALVSATGRFGELSAARGRTVEARSYLHRALELSRQLDAPDLAARWNRELGRIEYAHGDRLAALRLYDAATGSLNSIAGALVFGHRGDPGLYSRTIRSIHDEQSSIMLAIAEQNESGPERNRWLLGLRSVTEDLKRVELEQHYIDSCIAEHATAAAADIDRQINAGTAVIYPVVLSDRVLMIASFSGGEIQAFSVPVDIRKLERSVSHLRRELRPAGNLRRLMKASRSLHEWLVTPLEPALKHHRIDTLVFIPDDFLRLIPFAVLHDSRQFLIERFAVAVNPGLGLSVPGRSGAMERLLLFGLTEPADGFPPLPYVASELEGIAGNFRNNLHINADFSKSEVRSRLRYGRYDGVVFSSHALVADDPRDSFLLAYDDRISLHELDDYLRTHTAQDSMLDLLVLSACETAQGDERAALGLAGVGLRAGSASVLATLWPVNDESTADLVTAFFSGLKQPGSTKALALQQAQRALIADNRFSHPYFWAPFTLIGDWM